MEEYKIKVIRRKGASCVSVVSDEPVYTCNGHPDPKGTIATYKQKTNKRFRILKKLGVLWLENGKNLVQQKSQV